MTDTSQTLREALAARIAAQKVTAAKVRKASESDKPKRDAARDALAQVREDRAVARGDRTAAKALMVEARAAADRPTALRLRAQARDLYADAAHGDVIVSASERKAHAVRGKALTAVAVTRKARAAHSDALAATAHARAASADYAARVALTSETPATVAAIVPVPSPATVAAAIMARKAS